MEVIHAGRHFEGDATIDYQESHNNEDAISP
jgi:hypothetical protein